MFFARLTLGEHHQEAFELPPYPENCRAAHAIVEHGGIALQPAGVLQPRKEDPNPLP